MAKLILDEIQLEELLTEIIAGKKIFTYGDKTFAVRFPTSDEKDNSRVFYIRRYKELVVAGLPKKEDFIKLLLNSGNLDRDFFKKKEALQNKMDKLLKARDKTGSGIQLAQIEKEIYNICDKISNLEIYESKLLLNTAEVRAESYKLDYLLFCCLLKGEELDEKYWSSFSAFKEETDLDFIKEARYYYKELNSGIHGEYIRAVARSEEWKKRWTISKKTGTPVFNGVSSDWDKNKIELCYWSNFYDNIRENCPELPESLFEDDDKLFDTLREINKSRRRGSNDNDGQDGTVSKKIGMAYKVRY